MSIYRVSTANAYDVTLQNINQRNNDLSTSQERLSSGKRVLKASDDAVAATLSERAQNRLARTQADLRALEASRTALTQAESGLGEATDIVQRVRELMVQAGNPVLTPNTRKDLALQLQGLREQMLAVSNRVDTAGQTLFGGLGGALKPFVDVYGTAPGVQFRGQAGQYLPTESSLPNTVDGDAVWMRVPQGNGTFTVSLAQTNTGSVRTDMGAVTGALPAALDTNPTPPAAAGLGYQVTFGGTADAPTFTIEQIVSTSPTATTPLVQPIANQPYVADQTVSFDGGVELTFSGKPAPGDTITLSPVLGQAGDIFQTIQNTIDALRYNGPNQGAYLTQELGRGLTEIDAGLDNILAVRGRVGEWLNRADSMEGLFKDREVAYEKENSDLTDVDFVEAISKFQTQQTALDAALKSYTQVQRLSLFQYIA